MQASEPVVGKTLCIFNGKGRFALIPYRIKSLSNWPEVTFQDAEVFESQCTCGTGEYGDKGDQNQDHETWLNSMSSSDVLKRHESANPG